MTLLLFLTGLSTIASSGSTAATPSGLFAVSGGQPTMEFQVTQVSYLPSPMSARTE
jgi:hypothetical protein